MTECFPSEQNRLRHSLAGTLLPFWLLLVGCQVSYEPDLRCVNCDASPPGPEDDGLGGLGGTAGEDARSTEPPSSPRSPDEPPSAPAPSCKSLGDFVVSEPADVQALTDICEITGRLAIASGQPLETLSLPALKKVREFDVLYGVETLELPALQTAEALRIQAPELTSLSLPALHSVGTLYLATTQLAEIELASLETTERIFVESSSIEGLSLPALETIGSLQFRDLPKLTALALPVDVQLGSLRVERTGIATLGSAPLTDLLYLELLENPALVDVEIEGVVHLLNLVLFRNGTTRLSLPKLESVEYSTLLQDNDQLTSVELPMLQQASLWIDGNEMLGSVALPELVQGAMRLTGNAALSSVSLPQLANATDVEINGNPELSEFGAPLLSGVTNVSVYNSAGLEDLSLPALVEASSVQLSSPSLRDFSAPLLETVGSLSLSDTGLERLALPMLTEATTVYVQQNRLLTDLSLPALTTLLQLTMSRNPLLPSLYLPEFVNGGEIIIEENLQLATIFLPKLASMVTEYLDGLLTIRSNVSLVSLRLPNLVTAGRVSIDGESLTTLDLSSLESMRSFALGGTKVATLDGAVFQLITTLDSLTLGGNANLTSATFTNLKVVQNLSISGPGPVSVDFPALTHVGTLWIGKTSLTSFPFSQLQSVDGSIDVYDNQELLAVDLSAATLVNTSYVTFTGNLKLASIALPAVTTGVLSLENNSALVSVALPGLTQVSTLIVRGNAALSSLNLPALTSIYSSLWIQTNASLATLSAPVLDFLPFATITGNPVLATCTGALVSGIGDCP